MTLTRCSACKIVAIFLAVVSIVGNALVCHVIVRLRTMKTSINYIILNLAILDAIMGFFAILFVFVNDIQGALFGEPLLLQAYNQSSTFADIICKVHASIWFPFTVSPLLLMIMAYERFKAIVDPLSRLNDTATKSRLKWMLPLAWILGAVFVVLEMIIIHYDAKTSHCYDVYVHMPPWYDHKIVLIAYLSIQLIIPSTAMVIFYGCIVSALRKQSIALGSQAEAQRARRNAAKNVMWIIISVTIVFYICCGIPNTFYTLEIFFGNSLLDGELSSDIKIVLITLNSAFNPLIYFLLMKSFRNGFKQVFLSSQVIAAPNNELEMSVHSRSTLTSYKGNAENAI